MNISNSLTENIETAKKLLPIGTSFDFITRNLKIQDTGVYFIGINGLNNQDLLQKVLFQMQRSNGNSPLEDLRDFAAANIGFGQVTLTSEWETIIQNVLSGPCVLFFDGFYDAIILDTRTYPVRGIEEPENEKVLRGSKDGFVETLLFNTNLIRRRIRSNALTFEIFNLGKKSHMDVAIAYDASLADLEFVEKLKDKLNSIHASSLTMGTKSLEELLIPRKWFHPLPATFRTERPDVACSYLMEGYVLLMVDTTPSCIILPCNIFQFTQSPEDYYKSPLIGNYIRFFRFVCFFLSLFLLPVFLLFTTSPSLLPAGINLLPTGNLSPLQLFIYVLFAELLLDLFKYSSSHAPGGFSGAFSIVGGLLIGDVAVSLNWASKEIIFYAAATMLASLGLNNIDFSDAIRMYRLFLILLTGLFGLPGFLTGVFLITLSVITTPGFLKKSYFWPLFPPDWSALKTLLFRYPTIMSQPNTIKRQNKN